MNVHGRARLSAIRLWAGARLALVGVGILWLLALGSLATVTAVAAGPPFPAPTQGQRVYDTAGVFSTATIGQAEAIIQRIEARTGAQIAVFTQLKPQPNTPELAQADARALMDQWGVGRRGFDDGLVILFDLDASLRHGQVQLFAGSGFRASFLDDGERQAIFEEDMLPALQRGDLDGALLLALDRVDAAATPEHAAALARGRQANGLIAFVGLLLALLLAAYWAFHWLRYGRDPTYVDDPSILMPAPPPGLTAALGALVYDGHSTRHTLTTGLVDLASRGDLAVERADHGRVGVVLTEPDPGNARVARERARPLGRAERLVLEALRELGGEDGYVSPESLQELATRVRRYDRELEQAAVSAGWFTAEPSIVVRRWMLASFAELVVGVTVVAAGLLLPSSGASIAGAAITAAGIVTLIGAWAMPARTMGGAMIRAMLAAYRRTLQKTMAQARSMEQVVASGTLRWIETPDQALVWGVALGLQHEIEQVLRRNLEDLRDGAAPAAWFPAWYVTQSGSGGAGGEAVGAVAPGLLSASALPDVGGMFAAIGTIGASTSPGGSGGFAGGVSAGGGGAGGGF